MKMMTSKFAFAPTAAERSAGRLMRAPDHDASTGGGEASNADKGQDGGKSGDEGLTTEEKLEREFDNHDDNVADEEADGSAGDSDGGDDEGDDGDEEEEDGDDDGDDNADEGDEDSEGDDEADEPKPKKNRAQERIDELTNRSRESEREAERLRNELVRRGINPDSLEGLEAEPEEPDASKYEYGDKDVDYIRDKAKYDAKMEMREEQATALFQSQAADLEAKWTKNLASAATRYEDFDEVVVKGAEKWECPPVIAVGIKDSDYGPDIAYTLAKDPAEASRIAKLSPIEQAREFGRLEERQHQTAEAAKRKEERNQREQQPRRISKAPTPPKRTTRGSGARRDANYDTDDFAQFERNVDDNKLIRTT